MIDVILCLTWNSWISILVNNYTGAENNYRYFTYIALLFHEYDTKIWSLFKRSIYIMWWDIKLLLLLAGLGTWILSDVRPHSLGKT